MDKKCLMMLHRSSILGMTKYCRKIPMCMSPCYSGSSRRNLFGSLVSNYILRACSVQWKELVLFQDGRLLAISVHARPLLPARGRTWHDRSWNSSLQSSTCSLLHPEARRVGCCFACLLHRTRPSGPQGSG